VTRRPVHPKPVGHPPGRLHAAAKKARAEAEAHLSKDFPRFQAAVERYVNAVEVADAARQEWERLKRPMTSVGSQRQEVEHPFLRTMERLDRSAAAFGAMLGLDPTSSRRLGRVGGARPAAWRRIGA
jgi:phage terminase small subunit